MDPADGAGSQLAMNNMNNRHPMVRHAAMAADTAIHAENGVLKRRLRQYAATLKQVSVRAREEVLTALQQRNEALSKTSSVEFERDEALEESNALRSALHELRTRHEESARSLLSVQEQYSRVREDSNAHKTELKRLRVLAHTLEKRLKDSGAQNAKSSALAQAHVMEMKGRTEERDTLKDELAIANSELNATKRELAVVRHTLDTQAPPEITQSVRNDIARNAAEQVEMRTLRLLQDIARHYVEFQLAPGNTKTSTSNVSISSRSRGVSGVGGADEDQLSHEAAQQEDELAARVKALAETVIRAANGDGEEGEGSELPVAEDFLREHLAFIKKMSKTSEVANENDNDNSEDEEESSDEDDSSDEETDEEEELESESTPEKPSVPPAAAETTAQEPIDVAQPSATEKSRELEASTENSEATPPPVDAPVVPDEPAEPVHSEEAAEEIAEPPLSEATAEPAEVPDEAPQPEETEETTEVATREIIPEPSAQPDKVGGSTETQPDEPEVADRPAEPVVDSKLTESDASVATAPAESKPVEKVQETTSEEPEDSVLVNPPENSKNVASRSIEAITEKVQEAPSKEPEDEEQAEPTENTETVTSRSVETITEKAPEASPEKREAEEQTKPPESTETIATRSVETITEKAQISPFEKLEVESDAKPPDNTENIASRSVETPSEVVADINKAVLVEEAEAKSPEPTKAATKEEIYEDQKKGEAESLAVLEEQVLMGSVTNRGLDNDNNDDIGGVQEELANLEEEEALKIAEMENMIKGIGLDIDEEESDAVDGVTSSMEMDSLMAEINSASRDIDQVNKSSEMENLVREVNESSAENQDKADDAEILKVKKDTEELLAVVSKLETAVEKEQQPSKMDTISNAARIASAKANSASIKAHMASVKARIASVEARIASIEAIKAVILSGTNDINDGGNETNETDSGNTNDHNSENGDDKDNGKPKHNIDESALAHDVFHAKEDIHVDNDQTAAVYLEDRNVASLAGSRGLPTGPPPVVLMDGDSVDIETDKVESPMSVKDYIQSGDKIAETVASEAAMVRNAAVNELSKRISKVSTAVPEYADEEIDVSGQPNGISNGNGRHAFIDDDDDITEEDSESDTEDDLDIDMDAPFVGGLPNHSNGNGTGNSHSIPRRPAWPPPNEEQFRRMPPHARDAFR